MSKQGWELHRITGEPYEIGRQLGELARPAFDAYMRQSTAWRALQAWRGHAFVQHLRDVACAHHPAQLAELDGMAAGLGWPAADVFLWNCRGELLHDTPDGCTTFAAVRTGDTLIAHNEDGDPFLLGKGLLVDVRPPGKPGFISFYYPGSLPGHTFATNRAGLVQAINNLRIRHPVTGVPRMILSRAVLDTSTLDEAVRLLHDTPRASGFHHTLGTAGERRVISVEATAMRCSVESIGRVSGHANHMIHPGCDGEAQIVTDSSRDRQARIAALLEARGAQPDGSVLVDMLHDKAPAGLPIYREDPDDPDDENTLATALFQIRDDGVALQVHAQRAVVFETFVARTAA
ncbi:C45 family peptidase [Paraburkholderia phymatum]|uniref:Peptidase C45 acyl-coenzyme A:6-aminopenicillanic acid acyl-transferase n=1 Tax=Paraburkholderia phymatum (strain DSM 17167 / CIP 108236 / LMG 21445 / STM815) TaxID=391038 RepID=B2JMG7_PARP8|nr:C45 family peptidase [Paraburkholderia phymatum]ACC74302.1 peptidase C45 acyl-coenzyme A:6-aminopenicillanic acid acyl-transferase [Paraburkholderia phymatum STM815]